MEVKDAMTEEVMMCSPDTRVSEILGLMQKHKIHQLPVIGGGDKLHEKGEILGMVTLNKITISEVNPSKTKVKAFIQSCPVLSPDENLRRAARILLDSNLRAIPVWDNGIAGILSEQDIMKNLKVDGDASDVARKCFFVSLDDPVAKVKHIMAKNKVSRVAVINKGKLEGVVGSLDLLSLISGWQSFEVKGSSRTPNLAEKTNANKAPARNFMHKSQVLGYESSLPSAVKALKGNEEVLLEKDGEYFIITPKDILRIFVQEQQSQTVQLAGVDESDDPVAVAKMVESAESLVQTLGRSIRVQSMKIYVKKHKSQSSKPRYSVRIELPTSVGLIVATKENEWEKNNYGDLLSAFQKELDDIEKQTRKHIEKNRSPEKEWKAKRMAKRGF